MTKVVAVSDLHGSLPTIPECDLLLIAGDVCPMQNHQLLYQEDFLTKKFAPWLESVPAKEIVGIAGNHDFVAEYNPKIMYDLPWTYLCDEQAVSDSGLLIFGSPWIVPIWGVFMKPDAQQAEVWDQIPQDVDILLVHTPPYGIRDYSLMGHVHAGSKSLRNKLAYGDYPKLKLVVFGHIHEAYGVEKPREVTFVNASYNTIDYQPTNEVLEFEL